MAYEACHEKTDLKSQSVRKSKLAKISKNRFSFNSIFQSFSDFDFLTEWLLRSLSLSYQKKDGRGHVRHRPWGLFSRDACHTRRFPFLQRWISCYNNWDPKYSCRPFPDFRIHSFPKEMQNWFIYFSWGPWSRSCNPSTCCACSTCPSVAQPWPCSPWKINKSISDFFLEKSVWQIKNDRHFDSYAFDSLLMEDFSFSFLDVIHFFVTKITHSLSTIS